MTVFAFLMICLFSKYPPVVVQLGEAAAHASPTMAPIKTLHNTSMSCTAQGVFLADQSEIQTFLWQNDDSVDVGVK